MDPALSQSGDAGNRAGTQLRLADQATWDRYYREASRRRRSRGGLRESFHREKQRRRRREYVFVAGSGLLIAALTLLFNFVLSR